MATEINSSFVTSANKKAIESKKLATAAHTIFDGIFSDYCTSKRNNSRSGFTMLELVFIIVILGILASIAVPKMVANRDDAIYATYAADLDTFAHALPASYMAKEKIDNFHDVVTYSKERWFPATQNPWIRPEGVNAKCELTLVSKLALSKSTQNENDHCIIVCIFSGTDKKRKLAIAPGIFGGRNTPGTGGCVPLYERLGWSGHDDTNYNWTIPHQRIIPLEGASIK